MLSDKTRLLFQKLSTSKSILILFLLSHGVLVLMMTWTFPKIKQQIGTDPFDLRPSGYSFEEASLILNNLDLPTTKLYLFPQLLLLDILYPLLLALLLSSIIYRLSSLAIINTRIIPFLVTIPFIAMTSDYFENQCIILMISRSVELTELFVKFSSTFTILKGVFTSTSWIIVIILSIIWAKKRFQGQVKKV
jgi:hypothetical protein